MLTKFSILNPAYSEFTEGDPEFATQLNVQFDQHGGFDLELSNGTERIWFTFDLKMEEHDETISSVESFVSFLNNYRDHLSRLRRKATSGKVGEFDL